MSQKYKKLFIILDYTEQFLMLVSVITICISISVFASLVGILIGITSFAVSLKIVQ